jgi:4-hydroxy-3-methylbut-2-enyl diphosphate reductase
MGVKRAMEMAMDAAARAGPEGVYTLGPLIHNPQAVAELEAAGVRGLSEGEIDGRVEGRKVVLRAHGVPPDLRERLASLGAMIVDATCPRVLASQKRAAAYAAKGWQVVIAGEKGHGEVTGIAGHAPGALVAGSPEEARALADRLRREAPGGARPVALIAQTTITREEYEAIRAALDESLTQLEAVDSICPCTEDRLRALTELAAEVDAIVVVGGRNSANTARLLATARALGRPAWLVETASELPAELRDYGRIGLAAGASTPERLIAEVEAALLGP